MSADNWTRCPRCLREAREAAAAARDAVMDLYGTIPVEEFDVRRAELTDVDPYDYTTFREDYEFYGADEGCVEAHYSGHCTVCNLSAKFEHTHRFWPDTEAGA